MRSLAFFAINSELLIVSFECRKHLFKKETLYNVKNENNKIKVDIKIWQDERIVVVNCYLENKMLFSQALPYYKGRKYSITYRFNIEKEPLIFDNLSSKIDSTYGIVSEHYIQIGDEKERVYLCEKVANL